MGLASLGGYTRATAARVVSFALIGALVLTGLAAARPSASAVAVGIDPECATVPEECVTVTVANSGDGAGYTKVVGPSGTFVVCRYENGANSGACSFTWHVGPTGDVIRVIVIADDGSVGCFPTCAAGLVGYDRTVQPGVWSVDVAFWDLTQTIEVSLDGPGSGRVVSNPAGIDCPDDCSMEATYGDTLHLTATPDTGMVFEGWSGGACGGQDATCDYQVEYGVISITATFVLSPPISQPPQSASPSALLTPSPRPSASTPATAGPVASAEASSGPSSSAPASSPLASESAGPSAPSASEAPPTPAATLAPIAPAGDSGSGPGPLLLLLVIALALGGGGAWWWRRRSAVAP